MLHSSRLMDTTNLSPPRAAANATDSPQTWLALVTRCLRRTVGTVLRFGPVPQHIAFIMDGNRRFAERRREDRAAGHTYGFHKVRFFILWG